MTRGDGIMTEENSLLDNNIVYIAGEVVREPKLSHEIFGEKFYTFRMEVERLSRAKDNLPVLISERLIDLELLTNGTFLECEGQFRSYNSTVDGRSKLLLNIFARDVRILQSLDGIKNRNSVFFDGFICKDPNYRTTPFGREITDILLAVNRAYNKSDYIPCICWGRNARYCEKLDVGVNLKIWGRIQSRYYEKKTDENTVVKRVAYEVSVSKLEASDSQESQAN